MITVKEMIAALQTLEAEGKGDHPVIVTHWLGGHEPAGLPGLIDVRPGRPYGNDTGSLSDATRKPGDFEAVWIDFGEE